MTNAEKREHDDLRRQFYLYSLGDRPQSPPAWMIERLAHLDALAEEERYPTFAQHAPDCRRAVALRCPVGVECPHGYDFCPACDPCTCSADETGRPK